MFSIFKDPHYRNLWMASFILTLVASIFATGYHHPDEYMQIVEFANLKLGGTDAQSLPWEFHETMRPYFVPLLFFIVTKGLSVFGIHSPFFAIGVFHFLSGVLGFVAMSALASYFLNKKLVTLTADKAIASCFLLFCLPWFFTRGSSEAFSGALFLLSLIFCLRGQTLWAGVAAGLAFEARYQIAFLILGLFIQIFLTGRGRSLVRYSIGLAAVIGTALIIDRWGYGSWVFPPWNYFYQNVVLNKSAQWGTSPIVAYLYLMQSHGGALVSLAVFVAGVLQYRNWRTSVWFLPVAVFFMGHSLVGHKEMRFLFPLIPLMPLVIFDDKVVLPWLSAKKVLKPLFVYNFILLGFLCIWPSRTEISAQSFMLQNFKFGDMVTHHQKDLYLLGDNPVNFVKPKNLYSMPWGEEGITSFSSTTGVLWFLTDQSHRLDNQMPTLASLNCQEVWRAIPKAAQDFNFGNWLDRAGNWSIYKCLE